MKAILVLSMEVNTPDDVVTAITHMDPPNIPGFAGDLRIAVDDVAARVEAWLDEDEDAL